MPKPTVFVTRIIPEMGLKAVQDFCNTLVWQDELPPTREVLLDKVRGIDGLLCLLTDAIDAEIMDTAGNQLKVISNHAVGYDNIDIPAATARGIPVGNTPGILTDATADFTFALLMAAARRIIEADRFVRSGRWKTWGPSLLLGADLAESTLGIIGFGRIGQAVAKRASGFDMRILVYDPRPDLNALQTYNAQAVNLDTLLSLSDFISLHTPLNSETHHLIDADAFSKMKPSTVLINTARGPVVDPQALYTALQTGQIAAAGLDVTDPEPIPPDSPLLELENLVIAPHIASASHKTRSMMSWLAAQNLIAGLQGNRLPHCVNPEIYNE